jgi:hypothetical protein
VILKMMIDGAGAIVFSILDLFWNQETKENKKKKEIKKK